MNKKIDIIDYFKGLSIIGIVFYHLFSLYMHVPSAVRYAANAGSSGVLVFFFCSGFVLQHSQMAKQRSYGAFLKRRLTTIYIPYILVVFACAAIPIIHSNDNRWIALLSHVLQFRCISKTYFSSFGGHFWYVSTILQFYLLFIPLHKLLQRLGKRKFFALCTAINIVYIAVLAALHMENDTVFIRLFPKYLIFFAGGMAANQLYREEKLTVQRLNGVLLGVLGVAGLAVYGLSSQSAVGRLVNDIPEFIGVICLFTAAYKTGILKKVFTSISTVSYEIYLIHMPVMEMLFHFSNKSLRAELLLAVAALVITAVLSPLYHRFCGTITRRLS